MTNGDIQASGRRPAIMLALRIALGLALGLASNPTPVHAQAPPRSAEAARGPNLERFETEGRQSIMVVPGRRYEAGAFRSFFLGSEHRDLWNTPIRVDVLDLDTFAGGLIALRAGGAGQSLTLHMRGADGRRYVFRTVDKELTVPVGWENTVAEPLMQEMKVRGFHPGAAMAVAPLMAALDLLHAEPVMVVMPHHPALGEFDDVYAGLFGMIEERPDEGPDDTPGFAGSRKIVATETLLERLEESPIHRLDQRDYLKARLLDVLLGDRNRHTDNWRWARFDDGDLGYVWRPIARDRDEAFVANDGLLWSLGRMYNSRFQSFDAKYGDVLGITESGWELDRELLTELDGQVWDSVAQSMQVALTDAVIEDAVAHMPPELHRLSGASLEAALKERRDGLPEQARVYYRALAEAPDVFATDEEDLAVLRHRSDGSLEVSLYRGAEAGIEGTRPYYHRRFVPDETDEVRLYLRGGDDHAVVSGEGGRVTVRIVGGGGDDVLVDSTSGASASTAFYDHRGENEFIATDDTRIDTHKYERTASGSTAHPYVLDWGRDRDPIPVVGLDGDVGLVLGWGISSTKFGFRKVPYERKLSARAGVATSGRAMLELEADFIDIRPGIGLNVRAGASGVEGARFHGFGNETTLGAASTFYEVKRYDFWLEPSITLRPTSWAVLSTGPVVRATSTSEEGSRLINRDRPYALGRDFWETGWRLGLTTDTRDSHSWPTKGGYLSVNARAFPAVLDVVEPFATLDAEASRYLSVNVPTRMTLALRAGGRKTWGKTPYHEAAYLGGSNSLRGFRRDRFVGDASLFGGAELRIPVGKANMLSFPTEWGVLGLADVGRVYLDGEDSNRWHSTFGGGIWLAPMNRGYTLSLSLAHSDEENRLYGGFGFTF